MKFVALVALSLALVQAADVHHALEPQSLIQGGGCPLSCPVGQVQLPSCQCQCAPGRAGAAGAFDVGTQGCSLCEAGKYADEAGQVSCKTCPANTQGSFLDGTFCICEKGYSGSGTHADPCTTCGTGTFQKRVGGPCKACGTCPSNTNPVSGCSRNQDSMCECAIGHAGKAGAFEVGTAACEACGENTYQDAAGKESCTPCPANSARSTDQDATTCFCNAGFYGPGKGAAGCQACDAGKFQSEAGQNSCSNCNTCSAGDGMVKAQDCSTSEDTSCKCAAGFHGTRGDFVYGDGDCEPCDPNDGQYQDSEGQASCKDCVSCDDGEVEADSCTSTTNTQCYCGAGYFGSTGVYEAGSGTCSQCAAGTYNDEIKAAQCKACGSCDANKGYQHVEDCSGSADTVCECAPGHWGANSEFAAGQDGACTACGQNFFQDLAGEASCKRCPDSSSSATGATVCECDAGHTGDGKTSCAQCAPGKYKSSAGNNACDNCPSGATSSAGATECVADAGHTKNGDTFTECPADTYKSDVGNTACEPCGDNSSSGAGSTSANDCVCNQGYEGTAGSCTRIRQFVSGTINNFSLTAKTITFSDISDPVVFVSPLTYNGPDSAVTRVVAGNNQYSVEIEEPDCLDQRHPVEESCDWLVIQKGDLQYGGSTISVFTADVAVDLNGYETVTFPQGGAFGNQPPTCFAYIQSKNNDYYLAPRIKSTSATELRVRIEADERKKKDKASYNSETLGFICFENGVTSLTGDWGNFGIGTTTTSRGNMDQDFSVNVGAGLTKVFSQMTTLSGGNPTIIRHKGLSNGVLTFRLQEDVCRDNDNFHIVETVSAFGFQ